MAACARGRDRAQHHAASGNATLHHDPQYYRIRNHLVDFLVARSKDLSHGRAPAQPVEVSPGPPIPSLPLSNPFS